MQMEMKRKPGQQMEMKRKLTSDKMDFKIKTVLRDKEEYCVMIKGLI